MYTLTAVFNGITKEVEDTDIVEAIERIRPEHLLTEMYLTINKDGQETERRLNLVQGRKLFANPDFKQIFINNLLLDA